MISSCTSLVQRFTVSSFLAFAICALFANTASAQDLEVPANLQAAIFKKVFAYVKIGPPKITIVHSAAGAKSKDDLLTQFKNVGLEADAVDDGNIAKVSGNVVYLVPGVSPAVAKKISKKFIITCSKDFITDGAAMMAIINAGGKPSLLANTTSIGAAGIEVDPQLFRIASQVK
ncbi:MAG: hypothetical protein EAZ92_03540 [Candidatus Kapaibacterium sp.]|nr:MAG: hypothetical protein EAZ92_03540 [Candidatus Kapabacteria bacterium]